MQIYPLKEEHIEDVVKLWNKLCVREMLYKPFTEESFRDKFIKNPNFEYEGTFAGIENGKVIGFVNSLYKKELLPGETFENTPGYITIVIIDESCRRRGYGTFLLIKAEDYLKSIGKTTAAVDFFNPINLEWYIPEKGMHDHPNAPGVDVSGSGYEFMKKNGYSERTKEISMYLSLKEFQIDEKIVQEREELGKRDIMIGYYDKYIHQGFDGLFTNLKHELWRKEIMDNISLTHPAPVIVAADNGKICGFAGPIRVQESGRGLFSGIGVDTMHRGLGIGKVMFSILCDGFKKEGAEFMSIFTGENNNAMGIYEAAGFVKVREWALFRKGI